MNFVYREENIFLEYRVSIIFEKIHYKLSLLGRKLFLEKNIENAHHKKEIER